MAVSPASNSTITSRYSIPLLFTLIAAGLAGNYFKFSLFLNIDFLFGSIFAMLALQFFGLGRGVLAAAAIAGYTYILWNHPYAIFIMTAEVATVGWLMGRRKMGMVLADTIYWLILGMPLVYVLYHFVMHVSPSGTYITMTKQGVNGIANALIARLIFTGYARQSRLSLTSYRETVYNLLAFFVLFPELIMLAVGSRSDFKETDIKIRTSLSQDSQHVAHTLEAWVVDRKNPIVNLAKMAAARTPQQMQPYLEMAKKSDSNFMRVGLLDREATISAYFPLIDELGQNVIGKNFADRPFIPILKQTLKPVLSEVVMGKVGTPKPRVSILVPVVSRGEYNGFVIGVLDLEQVREHIDNSLKKSAAIYTLIDKNSNVIISNRSDQTIMKPFERGIGTLELFDEGVSQWVPEWHDNSPVSERWQKSYYIAEKHIGDLAEWRVILEQPVAPFQKVLYDNYTGKLTLLFLVLLGALAMAELFSRMVTSTINKLSQITHDIPGRSEPYTTINWPESGIQETNVLIGNFKEMSKSIQQHVDVLEYLNDSLEERVESRTADLLEAKQFSEQIISSAQEGVIVYDRDLRYRVWNPYMEQITGMSADEVLARHPTELFPFLESAGLIERLEMVLSGETVFKIDFPYSVPKTGNTGWVSDQIGPLRNTKGEIIGVISTVRDITARKQLDDELQQALGNAKGTNIKMSRLLRTIAHEFRTPLGLLTGSADILDRYWDRLTSEKRFEQNEHIRSAARQLDEMIHSVISFNQLGDDRCVEFVMLRDIKTVCSTIAAEVETVWGNGHEMKVTIAEDCGAVLLDEILFRRILENLLTNAFRYTSSDGTVSLDVHRESSHLCLEISDTGIGIPEEDQVVMFDAFYRGSNIGGRRGLGLGLSIVSESLSHLGGIITVTSRIGEGTTMRVEIPVKDTI